MWLVAGEAAELAFRFTETLTGGQQERLVACVPRILQVNRRSGGSGHPVTSTAQRVHFSSRRFGWVAEQDLWISSVVRTGAMADFAANARFVGDDLFGC